MEKKPPGVSVIQTGDLSANEVYMHGWRQMCVCVLWYHSEFCMSYTRSYIGAFVLDVVFDEGSRVSVG